MLNPLLIVGPILLLSLVIYIGVLHVNVIVARHAATWPLPPSPLPHPLARQPRSKLPPSPNPLPPVLPPLSNSRRLYVFIFFFSHFFLHQNYFHLFIFPFQLQPFLHIHIPEDLVSLSFTLISTTFICYFYLIFIFVHLYYPTPYIIGKNPIWWLLTFPNITFAQNNLQHLHSFTHS